MLSQNRKTNEKVKLLEIFEIYIFLFFPIWNVMNSQAKISMILHKIYNYFQMALSTNAHFHDTMVKLVYEQFPFMLYFIMAWKFNLHDNNYHIFCGMLNLAHRKLPFMHLYLKQLLFCFSISSCQIVLNNVNCH